MAFTKTPHPKPSNAKKQHQKATPNGNAKNLQKECRFFTRRPLDGFRYG